MCKNDCASATTAEVESSGSSPPASSGPSVLCRDDSDPACEATAPPSSTSFPAMRWLWVSLLLASIVIACNSSNGSSCSSAGGICVLASCSAYCLNGTCFTPLPDSAQDCPSSLTNSDGVTNTGNPCCISPPETADSGTPVPPGDAGQPTDAAVGADADATVIADSS